MPRRRTKTRIEHLTAAHDHVRRAYAILNDDVDMRRTGGDLRIGLRDSREAARQLLGLLEAAIKADVPGTPPRPRRGSGLSHPLVWAPATALLLLDTMSDAVPF